LVGCFSLFPPMLPYHVPIFSCTISAIYSCSSEERYGCLSFFHIIITHFNLSCPYFLLANDFIKGFFKLSFLEVVSICTLLRYYVSNHLHTHQ
jgi:hypothetical protein